MSVDLTIKLVRSVRYRDVLDSTEVNMSRILQVSVPVTVSGRSTINQQAEIGLGDFDDIICLNTYPDDIVEVGTFYIAPTLGYEDPDYDGWSMYVTIRAAYENSVKYALLFAFAAAISQHQAMPVIDDSKVLAKEEIKYLADELIRLVSLQQQQSDLDDALRSYTEYVKNLYQKRLAY